MSGRSTMHPLCSTHATSAYPPTTTDFVFRKVLRQSVAAMCRQAGFEFIESNVLELLTHMLCSYIMEVGAMTRQFTELAGRTVSIPSDIIMSLIDLGTPVMELPDFFTKCQSQGTIVIAPPKQQTQSTPPTPLHVGNTRRHHAHIPDYLPPFPDPHTYIRTEISGEPELTYEKVREASAQLKRNSEASLRDFMLRTHPCTSVFSAFEQRMRQEARQILEETKRQQKARLIARQTQIETERLNEELKQGQDDEMPELFESAEADDPKSNSELENSTSGHINDILAENLFVLGESEHSLLRRRLPAICQILEPSLENYPYVSALICDEINEESSGNDATSNDPVATSSASQSDSVSGNPNVDSSQLSGVDKSTNDKNGSGNANSNTANTNVSATEEIPLDENPYLRAVRMPVRDEEEDGHTMEF